MHSSKTSLRFESLSPGHTRFAELRFLLSSAQNKDSDSRPYCGLTTRAGEAPSRTKVSQFPSTIMKAKLFAVFALLLFSITVSASETNLTSRADPGGAVTVTNLNGHQRFYVNYRAQRARLEKSLSDLVQARTAQTKEADLRSAAGVAPAGPNFPNPSFAQRKKAIEQQLAALELSRVDYEKRYPAAAQYAGIAPRPIPENRQRKMTERYFPSARTDR
jgi:hypothetical protein